MCGRVPEKERAREKKKKKTEKKFTQRAGKRTETARSEPGNELSAAEPRQLLASSCCPAAVIRPPVCWPASRTAGDQSSTGGRTAVCVRGGVIFIFLGGRERQMSRAPISLPHLSLSKSGGTEGRKGAGLAGSLLGPAGLFFFCYHAHTHRHRHTQNARIPLHHLIINFLSSSSPPDSTVSREEFTPAGERVEGGGGGQEGWMRGKPANTSILLHPACWHHLHHDAAQADQD